jgi:tricarballylate dehydrogenase
MASIDTSDIDVIVVGAGNAACASAASAVENGSKVLMIETAPENSRGGNSAFTGGAFRFSYNGIDDLMALCPSLADEDLDTIDFGTYTHEQYYDDIFRMTQYRADGDMCEILVTNSYESAKWMTSHGVDLIPATGRQAFKVDGKFRFWGGLALRINGGGEQMVMNWHEQMKKLGVKVIYECTATGLIHEESTGVTGVIVRHQGEEHELRAKSVVLACGGFESNAAMRAQYLGPGWDLAKVRGTAYNNGAGLKMALDLGAMPYGQFSGCHAVAWDVNAPPYGDITIGDQYQKHNVPFAVVVNANGDRFRDEGEDFHSYVYARYGGEILQQPGMFAFQIFDAKVQHLLRSEYRCKFLTKYSGNTIEELASKMEGANAANVVKTVKEFNEACKGDVPFDPNIHDGLCTEGLAINKTNWANRIDEPPFDAYAVTAGVTFTFGGVKVSGQTEVERSDGSLIKGLYAAGEIVGGLYFHGYASGTGLMAGATFGRIAGREAAVHAGTSN